MSSAGVSRVVPRNLNGTALHLEHRLRTDQDQTCAGRPASAVVLPSSGILMPVFAEQAWLDLHYQTVKGALLLLPSPPRIAPLQLRLVE